MTAEQITLLLTSLSSIAAIFSAILFLPQIFKSFSTKNTADNSIFLFIITFTANLLWIGFGITLLLQDKIGDAANLIWQNSFVAILSLILLIYKIIHIKNARKLHLTEAQYCLKLSSEKKQKNINKKPSKFRNFSWWKK